MRRKHENTVMMTGWLFADLLLALAVLFLVTNTTAIQRKPPPTLIVSPQVLDSSNCPGGITAPQCTVKVSESPDSSGDIIWSVASDISPSIQYSNAQGQLSPGKEVSVLISSIPCQNGSFTFSAKRQADKSQTTPVVVAFHCTPPQIKPERLDRTPHTFTLTVNNIDALIKSNSQDNDIKQQIRRQSILQGQSVGLAIVYGGAPDDTSIGQAQAIARKVYSILTSLGQDGFVFQRSSNYVPLYTLGASANQVQVDVFFFTR